MLVRFFNHGRVRKGALTRTGGGGAVRNYLLVASEDKTKPREGARLIYGNEVETTEVINGIKNNKIYTSGVLSFAPEESITDAQKIEIIESFEQNLFPGLMPGEYSGYWVEHKDKDRQELHFVFAEIHLPSGKALPVYYHNLDLKLVDSWKDLTNHDYGLVDPDDPSRTRAYRLKGYEYSLKKQQEKQQHAVVSGKTPPPLQVFDEENIGNWLIDEIASNEAIQTQADVIGLISEVFEITRIAKDGQSISIKNPNGGRNIKLKGMLYEREFSRQRFESLGTTQKRQPSDRAALQSINQREREKRQQRLEKRFASHRERDRGFKPNLDPKLEKSEQRADNRGPTAAESVNPSVEEFNADSQYIEPNHHHERDGREHTGERRPDHITGSGERSERSSGGDQPDDVAVDSKPNQAGQRAADARYPADDDSASTSIEPIVPARINRLGSHRFRDFRRYRFVRIPLLSGQTGISGPTAVGHAAALYQPNALRGQGIFYDGYLSEQARPRWGHHYAEKSVDRVLDQVRSEQQDLITDATGQLDVTDPSPAKQIFQTEVISHEPTDAYRTHHQTFRQTIERFAQPARGTDQSDSKRVTAAYRSDDQHRNHDTVSDLIDEIIGAYRPADRRQDEQPNPNDRSLLERINDYQSTTIGNVESTQGRISALGKKDTSSLDQIAGHLSNRRQRHRQYAERVKELHADSNHLSPIIADSHGKTREIRNRRIRRTFFYTPHFWRINTDADDVRTNASHLRGVLSEAQAISGVVLEMLKAMFKRMFEGVRDQLVGHAKAGRLTVATPDSSHVQTVTPDQAEAYVHQTPYNLSGYAKLVSTVDRVKGQGKSSDAPEPRQPSSRGPGF